MEKIENCWENLIITSCYNCETEREFYCNLPRGHKGPHETIIDDFKPTKITWEKIKES